jgi:hypothetical protein
MRKHVHLKSDAPVRTLERHAKMEPSLTVRFADISWMV